MLPEILSHPISTFTLSSSMKFTAIFKFSPHLKISNPYDFNIKISGN